MVVRTKNALESLYEADETAWLEMMAELVREGKHDDLDFSHLEEYLSDMAKRDRREIENRLAVLLTHLLKWKYQPDHRTGSWRGTIIAQRGELARELSGGVLRQHGLAVLEEMYAEAVERAAAETEMPASTFPPACPYTLDEVMTANVFGDE